MDLSPPAAPEGGDPAGRPRSTEEQSQRDESERAALAVVAAGDLSAFGPVARRHYPRLWSVAVRLLGDPEDAADAVQDGLVRAMRSAAGFRGDAQVGTWLHRIVVNAALDRIRRRAREPLSRADPHWQATASDAIAGADLAMDVRAALAAISPDQRAAIVLVDLEGWPVAQAAEILDLPVGTVKSRCSRGRAALAPLLAAHRNRFSAQEVKERTDGGAGRATRTDPAAEPGSTGGTGAA